MVCMTRPPRPSRWMASCLAVLVVAALGFANAEAPREFKTVSTSSLAPNTPESMPEGVRFQSEHSFTTIGNHQVNETQLADLRIAADAVGISLEEAADRYLWQDQFAKIANQLQDRYPDDYSGAMIMG